MTDPFYKDFSAPGLRLITQGEEMARTRKWIDYTSLGLTHAHIPELIRIVREIDAFFGLDAVIEPPDIYAPIHAWRVLGQLQAEEAILPLIELVIWDENGDVDWIMEEIPTAMSLIGSTALPSLRENLLNTLEMEWAPVTFSHCLAEIAQAHPESRDVCVQALMEALDRYETTDTEVNAFFVTYLADLKALEAVPLVEKAFMAEKVSFSVDGDFEDFQIRMGLLEKRLTPPPRYQHWGEDAFNLWDKEKEERQEKERRDREQEKKAKKKEKAAKKARKRHKKKK